MLSSSFVVVVTTLQGPWVNYFIDIANTYPYLWALYAIALVLPFVLCAACCVRTKVGRCYNNFTMSHNRVVKLHVQYVTCCLVLHKHTLNRHVSTYLWVYWCSPQISFGSCLTVFENIMRFTEQRVLLATVLLSLLNGYLHVWFIF